MGTAVKRRLLLVNDDPVELQRDKKILQESFNFAFFKGELNISTADSTEKMFAILEAVYADEKRPKEALLPEVILLAAKAEKENGLATLVDLKKNKRGLLFRSIPTMVISAAENDGNNEDTANQEAQAFDLGAMDYVRKPYDPEILRMRVARQIKNRDRAQVLKSAWEYDKTTAQRYRLQTDQFQRAISEIAISLLEGKDECTAKHAKSTEKYFKIMLRKLTSTKNEFTEEMNDWNDQEIILSAVQLHDIGKNAISDGILMSTKKFKPEDEPLKAVMAMHAAKGADIIKKLQEFFHDKNHHISKSLRFAENMARYHHAWWGKGEKGHPEGVHGEEIPLEARIMAIVDVYEALVSPRPYKQGLTHEAACKVIEESAPDVILGEQKQKQFDPGLVEIFRSVKDEFAEVTKESEKKGE